MEPDLDHYKASYKIASNALLRCDDSTDSLIVEFLLDCTRARLSNLESKLKRNRDDGD